LPMPIKALQDVLALRKTPFQHLPDQHAGNRPEAEIKVQSKGDDDSRAGQQHQGLCQEALADLAEIETRFLIASRLGAPDKIDYQPADIEELLGIDNQRGQ